MVVNLNVAKTFGPEPLRCGRQHSAQPLETLLHGPPNPEFYATLG